MFDPYHKWLGIPRADQPPTHYRLLGINPFESDPDVIANAADQRMAHVKRYQGGRHSAVSQEILNRIAAAKLCLLHPAKKADYDSQLRGANVKAVVPPAVAPPVWTASGASSPPHAVTWFTSWNRDGLWQTGVAVAVILLLSAGALTLLLRDTDSATTRAEAIPRQSTTDMRSPGWESRRSANPTPVNGKTLPSSTMSVSSSVSATVRNADEDHDANHDREARTEPVQPAAERGLATRPAMVSAESIPPLAPPSRAGMAVAQRAESLSGNGDWLRAGFNQSRDNVWSGVASPRFTIGSMEPRDFQTQFPAIAKTRDRTPKPVYLDDLEEVIAEIGWGELGKHGTTGYPLDQDDYGRRAVVRGKTPVHLLSTHPPDHGTAYVSYALADEFRTFHALVGILEVDKPRSGPLSRNPLYLGQAFSSLTFRVVGNGRVLWQSRPTRRSGEWQECNIPVQGVRLLELQVDCPGVKTFAWAAWADPRLDP